MAISASLIAAAIATHDLAAAEGGYIVGSVVELRVLNKLSAASEGLRIKVGERRQHAELEIAAIGCRSALPGEPPQAAALLEIREAGGGKPVYEGWLYSAEPGAFQHQLYALRLLGCEAR